MKGKYVALKRIAEDRKEWYCGRNWLRAGSHTLAIFSADYLNE